MNRRTFIAGLGSAAAWPVVARGQDQRLKRIGVLTPFDERDPEPHIWVGAFVRRLTELGWTDGRNVQIDYRWGSNDASRVLAFAKELVALQPDAILSGGTPSIVALRQLTKSVRIVFVQINDVLDLSLVESLAHPGGNITGFTQYDISIASKWLQLIKQLAPSVQRIAVLNYADSPSELAYAREIERYAPSLGVLVTKIGVRNATELERAIETFARNLNGSLVALASPVTLYNRELIVRLAARYRLPAIYPFRYFTAGGGLASYGIDPADPYQRAALYVDRILRGEKPADLPVQAPTKYELVINLKTAKALGLDISRDMLSIADEVIE